MLRPFQRVAKAFIFTFGITPPRPEKERSAAIFISSLLLGSLLVVLGIGVLVLRAFLRM